MVSKPSKMASRKHIYKGRRGSGYRLLLFITCIQMDADSNHSCHERIMLFCKDHHAVQAVIIEYPVVDPFRCRALVIDFFVGIRAAGDIRIQTDIPFRAGFDDPSIFGRSAAVPVFGTMISPEGALSHEVTAGFVITVW